MTHSSNASKEATLALRLACIFSHNYSKDFVILALV
jgi:hypothetical protein